MHPWPVLQQLAVDLTRSLGAGDRYQRLLETVRAAIPCEATSLLAPACSRAAGGPKQWPYRTAQAR